MVFSIELLSGRDANRRPFSWIIRLAGAHLGNWIVILGFFLAIASPMSREAWGNGGNGGTGQTNTGGAATAGGGQTADSIGLTPEDAFAGGVDRSGAVGQNTGGAVGSNANAGGGRATGVGGGGFGGLGGGLGAAFGSLFGGGNANNNSSTPAIRTRLRSAIRMQAPASTRSASSARRTLASVPMTQDRTFRGLSVQVTGRRAVLSGEVRSDSDRRMSELLLRLEPGISSVDNRVLVVP
ncbi:MAG: BON domain-containing protein [Planctomycetota bacterium]